MIKVDVIVALSLGGHSTTAMQVASQCRSQNLSIRVAEILRLGTVRLIAQAGKSILREQSPGYQPLHLQLHRQAGVAYNASITN